MFHGGYFAQCMQSAEAESRTQPNNDFRDPSEHGPYELLMHDSFHELN